MCRKLLVQNIYLLFCSIFFSIYFRLIMSDVIQITADAWDFESFLQEYADYPFLAFGMVCPVRGCPDFTYYTRYHKFRSHRRERNVDYRLLFKCDVCVIVTNPIQIVMHTGLVLSHKGKFRMRAIYLQVTVDCLSFHLMA